MPDKGQGASLRTVALKGKGQTAIPGEGYFRQVAVGHGYLVRSWGIKHNSVRSEYNAQETSDWIHEWRHKEAPDNIDISVRLSKTFILDSMGAGEVRVV